MRIKKPNVSDVKGDKVYHCGFCKREVVQTTSGLFTCPKGHAPLFNTAEEVVGFGAGVKEGK